MEYHLTTPLTRADLDPLRAGDTVLLSGTCTPPGTPPISG